MKNLTIHPLGELPQNLDLHLRKASLPVNKKFFFPSPINDDKLFGSRRKQYNDPFLEKLMSALCGKLKVDRTRNGRIIEAYLTDKERHFLISYYLKGIPQKKIAANDDTYSTKAGVSLIMINAKEILASTFSTDLITIKQALKRLHAEHPAVKETLAKVRESLDNKTSVVCFDIENINYPDQARVPSVSDYITSAVCKMLRLPEDFRRANISIKGILEQTPYGNAVGWYNSDRALLGHSLIDYKGMSDHFPTETHHLFAQRLALNLSISLFEKLVDVLKISEDQHDYRRISIKRGFGQARTTTLHVSKAFKDYTHMELYLCPIDFHLHSTSQRLLAYAVNNTAGQRTRKYAGTIVFSAADETGKHEVKWHHPEKNPA
jgi:hypothetical protein